MSSMKLYKPSNSYGSNQRNFSEYEYKNHMSQYNSSNYEFDNKSNYNIQAPQYVLGQSTGECDANEFSQARANKSTNFYANAQRAHPSPSIHVQQGHHNFAMEKMKRSESHMGQDWAGNSPKYSNSALLDNSSQILHNEKHMMVEMGQDWAKKSNQFSGQAQSHNYGQSMYKGRDEEAYGYEGGYANSAALLATPNHLSPIKTNQSSLAHKEEHKMGIVENSWANSNSNFSSPTQAQYSGVKMHNKEHMAGNTNMNWANSPTKFSSSNQQSHFSMQRKEQMMENSDREFGYLPNKLSNPTQAHHTDMGYNAMHKEGHMMGKMDHGLPNKLSNPTQAHHTDMGYNAMHKEGHMMGKMDQGWSNSTPKFSSPSPTHHSSSNSFQAHQNNMSMQKGANMMGGMDNSWSSSPTKLSTPSQTHHSNFAMAKEEHVMGKSNHGWANSPTHYSGPNQANHFSSSNSMDREHKQHQWGGNSSNQFGANHVHNHSGHASYDNYDQYAGEDVNDIMDEILTKYPAHNVSGGHNGRGNGWGTDLNSCASQNLATSHAKQQAFGGSSHYRSDAQAMNAGYSSNFKKEEISSSSSSNKFETKGMVNNGGFYDDIF